jgi:hypothetical protein
MSANSLCFKEAHDAREKGWIEQEEYLRHVVNHYGGLRHDTDAEGQRPYIGAPNFAEDVRELVLNESFQPLDDNSKCFLAVTSCTVSYITYQVSQIWLSYTPFS